MVVPLRAGKLAEDPIDHFTVNVGQSVVTTLELKCMAEVVDSQAVQNGSVKVMQRDGIGRDVVTEVVGFPITASTLDAAPRQESRKTAGMMVASVIIGCRVTLAVDGTAKLASPDK